MWVLSLFLSSFFGYEIVTTIVLNRYDYLTRFFAGIPIGMMQSSFIIFLLQRFIDWGDFLTFVVDGGIFMAALLMHIINKKRRVSYIIKIQLSEVLCLSLYSIWLLYRMNLVLFCKGFQSRGSAYSDYSFHLNIISSLSIGSNRFRNSFFDIETPVSSGNKIAYPLFPAYLSSFLFASCGADFPEAFKYPAFLMGFSWVYLLHKLVLATTGSVLAANISFPLWVFSGGLGFLVIFDHGYITYEQNNNINYIFAWSQDLHAFWFQSLTHILNPQRSLTFTLPLCALAILFLIDGIKSFDWRYFLIAAITVSVMPQTQVHAYVSLGLYAITLCMLTFPFDDMFCQAFICWFIFGFVANVIAVPLCLPYFDKTSDDPTFISFSPIWKNGSYARGSFRFLKIWWYALGTFSVIAFIGVFIIMNGFQIKIYLASFPVVLIASSIMFQPWELDNTKLLHAIWFPIATCFVSNFFAFVWTKVRSITIKAIVVILYISCLISGIVNLYRTESFWAPFYDYENKESGHWISENTPVDSIFQMRNHVMIPSSCYAGRRLFYGYAGWVSSHGLTSNKKESSANEIETGENKATVKSNNVSYLIRNNQRKGERSNLDSKAWWSIQMEIGQYRVWKLIG